MEKVPDDGGQVHYPQLDSQSPSAPPPPPAYGTLTQPVPVQQTVIVATAEQFGPYPKAVVCINCGQSVQTTTRQKSGVCAWLLCALLCCVGCDCGCCLIPFCADSCQDVEHRCPNCEHYLGEYRRFNS